MTQTSELLAATIVLIREVDLTGVATVLLALGTFGLAWSTRRAAQATQRAAQAAQDGVSIAQQQLKEARRPIVAPIITAEVPASGPAGDPDRSELKIPLQNIGVGPALDVTITVRADTGAHDQEPVRQSAIAAGGKFVVHLNTFGAAGAPVFALEVEYRDIAGQHYAAAARWNAAAHRYDDIELKELV